MANVSEKFGLRPYRKLDGTPLVGAQNRYTIASGYATAIYQGDLVKVVTAEMSKDMMLLALLVYQLQL